MPIQEGSWAKIQREAYLSLFRGAGKLHKPSQRTRMVWVKTTCSLTAEAFRLTVPPPSFKL